MKATRLSLWEQNSEPVLTQRKQKPRPSERSHKPALPIDSQLAALSSLSLVYGYDTHTHTEPNYAGQSHHHFLRPRRFAQNTLPLRRPTSQSSRQRNHCHRHPRLPPVSGSARASPQRNACPCWWQGRLQYTSGAQTQPPSCSSRPQSSSRDDTDAYTGSMNRRCESDHSALTRRGVVFPCIA